MLRQGSILKREAAIYPAYTDPDEELTTFIARFYQEENHLLPKAILVPEDVDKDLFASEICSCKSAAGMMIWARLTL